MTGREKKMFDLIQDLYNDYYDIVEKIDYDRNEFDYHSLRKENIKLSNYRIDIRELEKELENDKNN